jgi:hypothetical protein
LISAFLHIRPDHSGTQPHLPQKFHHTCEVRYVKLSYRISTICL